MNEREQETVDYIRENWDRADRLAVFLLNRQDQQNYQHLRTAEQIVTPAYQSALRDVNYRPAESRWLVTAAESRLKNAQTN